MRRTVMAAAMAVLAIGGVTQAASAGPEATVASGRVRGVDADGVAAFKGLPYAAPPVGPLRWRPPQPAARWSGVREADAFGPACLQRTDSLGAVPTPVTEDCLTLNVWTPKERRGRLPVMVWIHGGGFVGGSGSGPLYDGARLAKRGVVLVTINYRLGRFGFFAHPALSAEHPGELVANYGLMDQIAALQWVQRNIAAFGGDPGDVTIFGESSGGAAVDRLMVSPAARGLFHRAIAQSGNGREYTPRLRAANADGLAAAEASGKAFALAVGVTGDDPAALRALPAQKILAAPDRTPIEGGPVIDGKLLPLEVYEAFEQGREAKVPFMVGSNDVELPIPPAAFEARFRTVVKVASEDRAEMARAYPDEATFKQRALSDIVFGEPARFLAAAHARNGQPAYLYRFSVLSAGMRPVLKGAPHASEIAYVFENLSALRWKADATDPARSAELAAYWTGFARTGAPAAAGLPAWPRYAPATDRLLEFTGDGPQARKTPDGAQLDAIAATYRDRPAPTANAGLQSDC